MNPQKKQEIDAKMNRLKQQFDKNLDYLKHHARSVYQQIIDTKKGPELIIDPENLTVNIKKDGQLVYPKSPIDFALDEVNSFYKIMDEKNYAPPPNALVLRNLIKKHPFTRSAMAYGQALQSSGLIRGKPAVIDIVVFGIGLGFHIEMLANTAKFTNITIIENDITFLIASLYTIKWWELLRNKTQGTSFTLHINPGEENKDNYHGTLKHHCHRLFPSISISTLIYNHQPFAQDYTEAKKIVEEYAIHMKVSSEMIAPEAQRLFNANENIKAGFPAIDLDQSKIAGKKIAIIGAGPSLDIYVDILRAHRDKFFVISSGSALSSLLKLDIKPDLHFELEFQNLAYKLLNHVNKSYPLSEFDLVGTYEVNPFFPSFFRNAYMFIPESSELQQLLGEKHTLRRGGMTCTNGATALAAQISDEDIYLFGLDFAYTNGEHHNKTNASQNPPEELKAITDKEFGRTTNLEVKDTQGNKVATSARLNSARLTMETLMPLINNQVYNCSHGANIKGTNFTSTEALTEQLNILENTEASYRLATVNIDHTLVFGRTKSLLNKTISVAREISEILKKTNTDPIENTNLVKSLFHKINMDFIHDIGQMRNTLSVVKYPLLQLFVFTNMLPEEKQQEVIDIWKSDYNNYIDYIEFLFNFSLTNNDFLVKKDWVGKGETITATAKEEEQENEQ